MSDPEGAALLLPLAQEPWRRWATTGWQALANILLARGLQVAAAGPPLDGVTSLGAGETEVALLRGPWRVVVSDCNPLLGSALQGLWPVVALVGPDDIKIDNAPSPHWLVRSPAYCVPCRQMGCSNRPDSAAVCLDWLSLRQVLRGVDAALELPRHVGPANRL